MQILLERVARRSSRIVPPNTVTHPRAKIFIGALFLSSECAWIREMLKRLRI
jgi:hypothetical protein